MRAFFLTFFLALTFTVSAQVDSYQRDIINYLTINGTVEQYGLVYDELFKVLKKQVASIDTPDTFWKTLKEGKEESLDELIFILSFAYRKHFTQDEIGELTKFYKTDAAQKMISNSPNLTEEDNDIITDFYASDIAVKVEAKHDDLSKDILEVSSTWSRELFSEKMGVIVKGGYAK